jgi:hypothetical protein
MLGPNADLRARGNATVRELIEDVRAELLFPARFSPACNPVENGSARLEQIVRWLPSMRKGTA